MTRRVYSITVPILPLARSLAGRYIGAKGTIALAAMLNETQITNLKCAAAAEVFVSCLCAPTDSATAHLCSLGHIQLCRNREGGITTKGITALCKGLKGSAVTSLRCAAALRVFALVSCQRPRWDACSLSAPTLPILCSLHGNRIGEHTTDGITALCEGLKGSSLTSLRCARPPVSDGWMDHACCLPYAHLTPLRPPHRSLQYNHLDGQAKQAIQDAAGGGVDIDF